MQRNIVEIDEKKCDGCGLCVEACHEKAIEIVNGKARLINDSYCDGLGDCLPACPQNAIKIIKREAAAFDEEAVQQRINAQKSLSPCSGGICPGSSHRKINTDNQLKSNNSQLEQWPIQLHLVPIEKDYFHNAELLIAADCTAFAYHNFHQELMKKKITLIGCPKLDRVDIYLEKLREIFKRNEIKSIDLVRMSVPCCGGLEKIVKQALLDSGKSLPLTETIIDVTGAIYQKKGA